MKISIITATYNSAKTVRDTLSSIATQQYKDVEHIIIDGISTDGTLNIVREFPHVLESNIYSGKDDGIYDAMNKGIEKATGEVIGILNSDDFYNSDLVLTKVAAAFADPSVDVVYGDLQYVKQDDVTVITRTWKAGVFHKRKFYFGWMPPHPTFFVRRRMYEKAFLFDKSFRSAADYELMLRMMMKYNAKAEYIPNVLVKMRTGGESNSSIKKRLEANSQDLRAWKANGLGGYYLIRILKPARKVFQYKIFQFLTR
jgi:glycosyltransferase involved in cell wall biosynthesis